MAFFNMSMTSPFASGMRDPIQGAALTAPSRSQSRATPAQGTSEGGLSGCRLAVICEQELASSLCGGKIGTAGIKMCILERTVCSTISHSAKAVFAPKVLSESGQYVMVEVNRKPGQVFLSNSAPKESFKNSLDVYLRETRSCDEWDDLFRSVKN